MSLKVIIGRNGAGKSDFLRETVMAHRGELVSDAEQAYSLLDDILGREGFRPWPALVERVERVLGCSIPHVLSTLSPAAVHTGVIITGAVCLHTLAVESLEEGLHPKAQQRLVKELYDIPYCARVFASTYSPYLLDEVRPEDILVSWRNTDHTIVRRPLIDHPEWSKWSRTMSPGVFWSMVGEEWVEGTHART